MWGDSEFWPEDGWGEGAGEGTLAATSTHPALPDSTQDAASVACLHFACMGASEGSQ